MAVDGSKTARPYDGAPRSSGPPSSSSPGELDAAELAQAAKLDVEVAERLLPVGKAMVARYAPDAPAEMKNESLIRFCAYLSQTTHHGITKISVKDIDIEFSERSHAAAFQHSGAKALLSPWRVRRGGVIE